MTTEKNYTVVGINGFRQGSLTRAQAIELAKRMQRMMAEAGWAGKMRVYYRDGSEVPLVDLAVAEEVQLLED